MLTGDDVIWQARTTNYKTSDVPTAYVGRTRAESLQSCEGCPLLAGRCYAHFGVQGMAHARLAKAAAKSPAKYTLEAALLNRSADARVARVSALGEPGRLPTEWWRSTRQALARAGLELLAYVHNWRQVSPYVRQLAMASCDSLAEVDEAVALGMRATVVLPADHEGRTFTTPAGRKGVVCPAMLAPGKVTCNTCRLCVASRPGPVIGFPEHGFPEHGRDRGEGARERSRERKAEVEAEVLDVAREGTVTRQLLYEELPHHPALVVRFALERLVERGAMRVLPGRLPDSRGRLIVQEFELVEELTPA